MPPMTAKELREKRAKLIADARAIRDRADQEKPARDLTAEEIGTQATMLADARRLGDELRNLEELEKEENLTTLPETQRQTPPTAEARVKAEQDRTAFR